MPPRYLIADDNAPFLEASRTLLSREGLDVIGTAANAAECLHLAGELNPDVILVDVDLGADSGLALARRLSELSALWQVIFMSTRSGEDYAELVTASPAVGFITKSELSRSAIETVLEKAGREQR
jgi:DNA-binding NarL/FixJ family response regulator